MEQGLLLGNATLHPDTKRLEHLLSIRFVERVTEPARGAEQFRVAKIFSCAVCHRLVNAYLCLKASITDVSPCSQFLALLRRSS